MAVDRSFQASETGKKIAKDAFELKGWTQEYLAANVQCSRSKVSHFFAGKQCNKNLFQKLCSELV
jgi:ribosome-binding protein aMBF1 (putative translation factor)